MPPPSFQKSAEKAAQISSKIFIEIDSWFASVAITCALARIKLQVSQELYCDRSERVKNAKEVP
jgi:hypothetical protein